MITLKEAFRLCGIDDQEVVHLTDNKEDINFWTWPMTGREVREKYDMKHTMVTDIRSHFNWGEYEGFTFVIKLDKAQEGE